MTASVPPSEQTRTAAAPAEDADQAAIDGGLAALAALVTLGAYLATVYPGLLAVGDAAKFAFVGKVLGTPHAPGYPLYLMVSHLFSYVPWGTLAYRMNILSALLGAITVGLSFLTMRRMGVARPAALSAALALGMGSSFWSRALYAKTYTLNAALVAAGMLALLRWDRTRRPTDLYLAAAIFALSLGNHLTVIAVLPAVVLFVLLTDPCVAVRPKTIAAVLVIVLLGLSQYGLIIVRTLQHAPYLEARATNLWELWTVMTARRFSSEIGAYSIATLRSTRVPAVTRLIAGELGPLGVPLLCLGFAALLLNRFRHLVLFGLGALGVAALTAGMSSNEDKGFLLSVFVLLCPIVGVGLNLVLQWVQRAPRQVAAGLIVGVASLLPCSLAITSYSPNDHHADIIETQYFDALFAALPQKAAIVKDEYSIDMMVLYKLLGEGAAGARDIRLVPRDRDSVAHAHDEGFEIFAFQMARRELEDVGFRLEPYELPVTGAPGGAAGSRSVYRLVSAPSCYDIGNLGWIDVSKAARPKGQLSIRIDNYRPFDAQVVIYADAEDRAEPILIGGSGAGTPVLSAEIFPHDDRPAQQRLVARVAADRVTLPVALAGARFVVRAEIRVNDRGAYSVVGLDLGSAPTVAVGRALVDRDNPKRATICSHPLGDVDAWPARETRVSFSPDAASVQFADGWYPVERRSDGSAIRWTADRAVLVLPIDHPRAAIVTIAAEPLAYKGRGDGAVTMSVNGHRGASRPLPPGPTVFSWDVPPDHWRNGLNVIVLDITGAARPADVGLSTDGRLLGIGVTRIGLAAPGSAQQ